MVNICPFHEHVAYKYYLICFNNIPQVLALLILLYTICIHISFKVNIQYFWQLDTWVTLIGFPMDDGLCDRTIVLISRKIPMYQDNNKNKLHYSVFLVGCLYTTIYIRLLSMI